MVPVTALRHGNNGDFVYVLKEDKTVTVRPVKRGAATVDKVQIAEGLKLGEQVITEGADRLKEGAKVTLPGAAGRRRHGAGGWKASAMARPRRAPAHRRRPAKRHPANTAAATRKARHNNESIRSIHPAPGSDFAADAGHRPGGHRRLQVPAAVGAAAGGLPDHPGADAVPGRQPEVMAQTVTAPLERQFGQMAGLSRMSSTSAAGVSIITLQFGLGQSLDVAEQEVQAAINAGNSLLPTTCRRRRSTPRSTRPTRRC
jgi:hypothetical protein